MEKILIVEDNKALAKMLALKIESTLPFEVHNAYSLKEAQLFVRKYDYFMALLDTNLPDAHNGEIVDVMLSKNINSIVVSANMDREFRHKMLEKDIIDYVGKGGIEDIEYVISMIRRLHKNQNHTVMLVDDSRVFRNQMKRMLEHLFFNVIACAHGEEALNLLQERDDIKIVITDYNMPVMNGLDLTKEIRKIYKKDLLSILAISSNNDEDISAMFLKKGATDFIKKPFSKEEFSCRINNTIEALENIALITNSANRDFMTGLYNRRYFLKSLEAYVEDASQSGEKFAVAMVEIDDINGVNDNQIISVAETLRSAVQPNDVVARFGSEDFGMLLKNISSQQTKVVLENISSHIETLSLTLSIGFTCNNDEAFEEVLNQADMMLYSAKSSGGDKIVGD
ncbi:MAG: response regulator [Campylobacterota bacterium]|nr:response regulator [Campylobacterota bacterium]